MNKKTITNILAKATLAVTTTALTLLMIEFGGRWILNRYPGGYDPGRFTTPHEVYGWLHKPNVTGYWYRYSDGTKNIVSTNFEGFSDHEFSTGKDPSVFRVIIIGDSVAQSWEVPENQRFVEILRRRLTGTSERKIELMNCAVRGYGTDQELLLLKNKVIGYSPNLVLLSFCLNDLNDNLSRHDKPFYTLENGTITLNNVPVKRTKKSWISFDVRDPMKYFRLHSWVFQSAYYRLSFLQSFDSYLKWRIAYHFPARNNSERRWVNFNLPSEEAGHGWHLFKELLRHMKSISDSNDSEFAVIGNVTKQALISLNAPEGSRDKENDYLLPFSRLNTIWVRLF